MPRKKKKNIEKENRANAYFLCFFPILCCLACCNDVNAKSQTSQ